MPTFTTTLASRGLSQDEAVRKQLLFELVADGLARVSPEPPAATLWVPGRLEILGKHTDYGGGHSLVAPVPRGFAVLARPRPDGVVSVHDASRREHFVTASQSGVEADDALTGWRRYVLTAVRRLARNFPGAALGADIVFASDLPPASGMSSSSALIVAVASALAHVGRLEAHAQWQANIPDAPARAGYFACIENGLTCGTLTGDSGVGTHGGSEDHLAIVCGKAGHGSVWRFVPPQHVTDIPVPAGWTFVVGVSGVSARKAGEARESYNQLALDVRALLAMWNETQPGAPARSLHAALASSPSAYDQLAAAVDRSRSPRASRLQDRLRHFIGEDARVLQAAEALQQADRARMRDLALASQHDAEELLRNQVPETTALVQLALEIGALASSSFGAGFGGSVWALVPTGEADEFAARWLADYRRRFPHHDAATTFVAPPGPGITSLEEGPTQD